MFKKNTHILGLCKFLSLFHVWLEAQQDIATVAVGWVYHDEFKEALDIYPSTIPDQPRIGSMMPTATDRLSGPQSNIPLAWANDHWHRTVSSDPEVTKLCLLLVFELVKSKKKNLKKTEQLLDG